MQITYCHKILICIPYGQQLTLVMYYKAGSAFPQRNFYNAVKPAHISGQHKVCKVQEEFETST